MALEDKDIIQIDAIVTTGFLIFLTLTNVGGVAGHTTFRTQFVLTLVVIIPFAISAILIGFENMKQGRSYEKYSFKELAIVFMMGGFIYLVFAVIILVVGSYNTTK